MIQSNELRIGNFLYCQGEIRKIVGISEDVIVKYLIDNDVYYCGFDEIEPIELTEEILLKCGFEKDIDDLYLDINIMLFVSYNDDEFVHLKSNNLETIISIKHLHELQNLYWCLCSEELNILFNE